MGKEGQQGSGLDKTVLKAHGGTEQVVQFLKWRRTHTPHLKKQKRLVEQEAWQAGRGGGAVAAEGSPGNRAFLCYTQSCVPSEPDPAKYSNLLVISCRQNSLICLKPPPQEEKRQRAKTKWFTLLKMNLPWEHELFSALEKQPRFVILTKCSFLQTEIKVDQGGLVLISVLHFLKLPPSQQFLLAGFSEIRRLGSQWLRTQDHFYKPSHPQFLAPWEDVLLQDEQS